MQIQPQADRLQHWLDVLSDAEVGGTPGGGVTRPAASAADGAVRDRFAEICVSLGLTVTVDDAGNMYGRREGRDRDAAPVVIGSHLDTVTPGGRFDGILGVALALEVVAALNDADLRTMRPIVVVNWTGEEGARFPPAMIGSGLVAGFWDEEYVHSRVDGDGTTLGEALREIGYLGDAKHRITEFFAALEVHIEQGTVLESAGVLLGIVPRIEPVRWFTVTVHGEGGHAGGAHAADRNEALVAASRMIAETRNRSREGRRFNATVGRVEAAPGSTNVVPHLVEFSLDLRSSDNEALDAVVAEIETLYRSIAAEEGVAVEVVPEWSLHTVPFAQPLRQRLSRAAERRGISWMETVGVIGHDALHLASMGPSAMLFVQTTDGISHAETEHAPWDSLFAAAEVLADSTLELADAISVATDDPQSESQQ